MVPVLVPYYGMMMMGVIAQLRYGTVPYSYSYQGAWMRDALAGDAPRMPLLGWLGWRWMGGAGACLLLTGPSSPDQAQHQPSQAKPRRQVRGLADRCPSPILLAPR